MNYTYKIDNFNAAESLMGVLYTNTDDDRLSVIFRRVFVTTTMTQQEIEDAIKLGAPIFEWEQEAAALDGDTTVIDNMVGTTTAAVYTPPTVATDLINVKAAKKLEVQNLQEEKIHSGVVYNTYWFKTGPTERADLTAAAAAAANGILPSNFTWVAFSDNTPGAARIEVNMTGADVVALAALVFNLVNDSYVAARIHNDAIDALPDEAAVAAYDITTGWPV